MKVLATFGIVLIVVQLCHAEQTCYYDDGTVLYCDSCCEFDCCYTGGSSIKLSYDTGLSHGAIAGIAIGAVVIFVLKMLCIYTIYRRRYQQRIIVTRVTAPSNTVMTNTHHVGYDQPRRVRNARKPKNTPQVQTSVTQTNPNHVGYDQDAPSIEPIAPPPYESLNLGPTK